VKIANLSAEPLGKLHSWIPYDLKAEQVVFLPDACPGKSPLPTGTAVLTRQQDWRRFAVSDCGRGMRLVRSSVPVKDLDTERWNAVADHLRANKGGLGRSGRRQSFLRRDCSLRRWATVFTYPHGVTERIPTRRCLD
jgi:hypothetical protein